MVFFYREASIFLSKELFFWNCIMFIGTIVRNLK